MRFRGVKVILRDGLEVTDQVRMDMFHAWQDLQLLHATQPGLQYKYMIGGKKSWKVSSLNGVDRIELLGYPPKEEKVKPVVKIQKHSIVGYYPAFEAFEDPDCENFIGIVVCKGGGFEPPYYFVSKDSLPQDRPTVPGEELPNERKWNTFIPAYGGVAFYEDLPPVGRAKILISFNTFKFPEIFYDNSHLGFVARSCWQSVTPIENSQGCIDLDYPPIIYPKSFTGVAVDVLRNDISENWGGERVLSFLYPDEEQTEYWDSFYYPGVRYFDEGYTTSMLGKKPVNVINTPIEAHHTVIGNGYSINSYVDTEKVTKNNSYSVQEPSLTVMGLFGYCALIDESITPASIKQDAIDKITTRGPVEYNSFVRTEDDRVNLTGWRKVDYSWTIEDKYPVFVTGYNKGYGTSVYDQNSVAAVFSDYIREKISHYINLDYDIVQHFQPAGSCSEGFPLPYEAIIVDDISYNNIEVLFDQDKHTVAEIVSTSKIINSDYVKYFDTNGSRHAMYYAETDDSMYFTYATKISNKEPEFFDTKLPIGEPIEAIGKTVYVSNKHSAFRLIYEQAIQVKEYI